MVSSVFSCFGVLLLDLRVFWTFFLFSFFWGLELGCGVLGACSLGRVLWGCSFAFRFVAPSDSSSFSVIAAHILRVPRCLLAVVFSAHILTFSTTPPLLCHFLLHRTIPLSPFISPHFLGLASVSFIDWSFTHSCLDSTISFGSLLLVTFIHSHLHLICFPVVIVISAQYHNTNFALLFFFPCALLVSTKMRIIRSVNP